MSREKVMETKITRERLITFLLETPMFMSLTPSELMEMVHVVEAEKYQAGDVIFEEGDSGEAWYVLYKGAVEVLKDDAEGRKKINARCTSKMAVKVPAKTGITVIRPHRDNQFGITFDW